MFNRRHLRIRVLQALYAWKKSPEKDFELSEKLFLQSLDKVEELYFLLLFYIVDLRDYAFTYIEKSKNKHLPNKADLSPNTKFIDNLFINSLKSNSILLKSVNLYNISFLGDQDVISNVFFKIKETSFFQDYMNLEDQDFESDKKFVAKLFGKYLVEEELFQEFLMEKNIHWDDDLPFITNMVIKTIKQANKNKIELFKLFKNKEDRQFALDLFRKTIINFDRFHTLISSKSNNWEIERVAEIDLLAMQMALTEILEMPTVPVKVAINEYIDMIKYYSTSKSKNFVNGILDSFLTDFKRDGSIKKTGRGLIE